jgi:hypothetical protein
MAADWLTNLHCFTINLQLLSAFYIQDELASQFTCHESENNDPIL